MFRRYVTLEELPEMPAIAWEGGSSPRARVDGRDYRNAQARGHDTNAHRRERKPQGQYLHRNQRREPTRVARRGRLTHPIRQVRGIRASGRAAECRPGGRARPCIAGWPTNWGRPMGLSRGYPSSLPDQSPGTGYRGVACSRAPSRRTRAESIGAFVNWWMRLRGE